MGALYIMNRLLIVFIFFIIFPSVADACRISPLKNVEHNFEKFEGKADVVFLGLVKSIKPLDNYEEIVSFEIIKNIKGLEVTEKIVTILNRFSTTCSSRFFAGIGNYYVFAKKTPNEHYIIDGYATFYPEHYEYEK